MLRALTSEDVAHLEEQPHLAKYYTWLRELTAKAAKESTPDDPEQRQEYMVATALQNVDGELVCRLGPLLPSILRGELTWTQLSTLLRKVAHKNPGARVLQIGTGMGVQATRRILETLGTPKTPLVASWHVTEPSSESLEDARSQLADWAKLLEFDQLDIEQSPAKQKFTPGSYDIIVAFQALRATKNVTSAVANVRSLLKPGSTFLFAETIKDQVDVDSSVACCRAGGKAKSPIAPTLTASSWDGVLRDAGFSGVDLEIRDSESDIIHTNSTVMSTVPLAEDQNSSLSNANHRESFAVVTSSKASPPPGFVDLLSRRIQALTGADTLAEHLVLEQSGFDTYKGEICVFVGEIDEPILAEPDTEPYRGERGTRAGRSPGLPACAAQRVHHPRFLSLDLGPAHAAERWSSGGEVVVSAIVEAPEEGFGRADTEAGPAEFEYAERDGVLHVPR
ncbi:phthiocerol synthesis polyketide synthase type I PpsC [Aspergillus udagawae]|uniref:Phthiocerol synthesis polyketide synthase type I PpsC n=1 Tax=Aspergillus udagawae TaxID=91492 RepID=A0A8H3SE16_9EURO|nr:phthiocerol synthesis polyketide synthase type I PpsC [Aspergillus udagawae]